MADENRISRRGALVAHAVGTAAAAGLSRTTSVLTGSVTMCDV